MKAFLLFLLLIILIIAVLKILNRKFIQKTHSMTGRKQGIHSNTVTPDEREADFNKWYVNTIKKQLSK